MIKIFLLLITFAQISFVLGQTNTLNLIDENDLKQGIWKEELDQKKYAYINYFNNKKNGEIKVFYPSNQLFVKGYFKNDLLDSLHITYHENGNIKMKTYFINGMENGVRKSFSEKGSLKSEYNVINDKETGFYKEYYDNGSIWVEYIPNPKDNQQGKYFTYYKSGKVCLEGEMVNFKRNGKWLEYKENGELKNTTIYKSDSVVNKITQAK